MPGADSAAHLVLRQEYERFTSDSVTTQSSSSSHHVGMVSCDCRLSMTAMLLLPLRVPVAWSHASAVAAFERPSCIGDDGVSHPPAGSGFERGMLGCACEPRITSSSSPSTSSSLWLLPSSSFVSHSCRSSYVSCRPCRASSSWKKAFFISWSSSLSSPPRALVPSRDIIGKGNFAPPRPPPDARR